ncbi:hypothetical protein HW572_12370 [Gordonia amicalis]|nr:hypothetical protein [Gordonia amicalis]
MKAASGRAGRVTDDGTPPAAGQLRNTKYRHLCAVSAEFGLATTADARS